MNTPDCLATRDPAVEPLAYAIGSELFGVIRRQKPSLFDPQRYSAQLMEWAMADDAFRTALFRFVDVLPALDSAAAVIRTAQEYFLPVADRFPGLLHWGLRMDPDGLQAKAAAFFVRRQIRSMGQQFILGETPADALSALRSIRKEGRAFTVDLLGEACLSDGEAEAYLQRYLELIAVLGSERFAPVAPDHPADRHPLNVSVKLSALCPHFKPQMADAAVAALVPVLARIFRAVRQAGGCLYVDMENTAKLDIILGAFRAVALDPEFRDWDGAGLALQAYLCRTPSDLAAIHEWVRTRGTRIAIRLVKGAYWDTETITARLQRWPVPVWQDKAASDICFESLAQYLLDHTDCFYPAFASHNVRSLAWAMAVAERRGLSKQAFEVQALYGMAEPIKEAVAARGYLVRDYAPVGALLPGMAYLVRRLLENTSNKGFIRQSFHEGETVDSLLRRPELAASLAGGLDYLPTLYRDRFVNAPFIDFTVAAERQRLAAAIDELWGATARQPALVHPVIGGRSVAGAGGTLQARSPQQPDRVLAEVTLADAVQTRAVLQGLRAAAAGWRDTPLATRCALLERVADRLDADRPALIACIVSECGKPLPEADADVAEAIDFCRYYARQAAALFEPRELCGMDGESDQLVYEPRGVTAVLAPWNFPLAIPCGMFAASLVCGNPTVLKPAEQSSLTAARLFAHFLAAGMPPDVAALLPGDGDTVGALLVAAPEVDTIAFTGSRAVGLRIIERAAVWQAGQTHVKRVIAEMGGKNAIIVDESADFDQAVAGVLESAFGFAGQKCSACSRVLVHAAVYERFRERLADAVRSLVTGPASDLACDCGPVIDSDAHSRLLALIARNGPPLAQGRLHPQAAATGYFVPATLYADVPFDSELMCDEWFGPVLAMAAVPDFEAGVARANASEYGLTGAVFSRSPRSLAYAARHFSVGNLYLNRGSTGALVGRQPFGGAKLSGVGSKAGGPDYLLQFTVPRVVTENTLRQGFAPMEET
jgi:RHH-type transcriptional regulator, proline utilization regulon repressor / proline dehydrogenase / delta 1-pyrroline-5-carboxylate dehydrogenase